MEKGLMLINTGPGKGKTSAALGVTIRALGQGLDVAFLQFVKSQPTGESHFLELYAEARPARAAQTARTGGEPSSCAASGSGPSGGGGAAFPPQAPEAPEPRLGRLFYKRMGLGFVFDSPGEDDRAKAAEALAEARGLLDGSFDLVVLDEICVAVSKGLIPLDQTLDLIRSRDERVNLILTGRGCPEELIALADTVTEMTVVKHAYQAGIKARRGIEF